MKKIYLSSLLMALALLPCLAQTGTDSRFTFPAEDESLFLSAQKNKDELKRLLDFTAEYHAMIRGGVPVQVRGYCNIHGTDRENLAAAQSRAERIRTEIIAGSGLREEDIVISALAEARDGNRDFVEVEVTIPESAASGAGAVAGIGSAERARLRQAERELKQQERNLEKAEKERLELAEKEAKEEQERQKQAERAMLKTERKAAQADPPKQIAAENSGQAQREWAGRETAESHTASAPKATSAGASGSYVNIRTNLLHWLALVPNAGIEWRINESFSVRLDGGWAGWEIGDGTTSKSHRLVYANPEVRYYLPSQLYLGVGGTIGQFNIKLGDKTGYQGDAWAVNASVGYVLHLKGALSLDFNLGLGYMNFKYDTFRIAENGIRVYKLKNRHSGLFGPTQAGVTLTWKIGRR